MFQLEVCLGLLSCNCSDCAVFICSKMLIESSKYIVCRVTFFLRSRSAAFSLVLFPIVLSLSLSLHDCQLAIGNVISVSCNKSVRGVYRSFTT